MKTNNKIQQNFYGSNFFLVRVPWLAHKAYGIARDNWLATLEAPRHKCILDIGCSDGSVLQSWSNTNTIVGLDCEPSVLMLARQNGLFPLLGDMNELPFAKKKFDIVCAFSILGINGPPEYDISRFSRVLKQDGRLLLSVAVLGGVRYLTRSIVTLLRVRNQMKMIPRLNRLEQALYTTGFDNVKLTTCSLVPSQKLYSKPGCIARNMATYAFIDARKH